MYISGTATVFRGVVAVVFAVSKPTCLHFQGADRAANAKLMPDLLVIQ